MQNVCLIGGERKARASRLHRVSRRRCIVVVRLTEATGPNEVNCITTPLIRCRSEAYKTGTTRLQPYFKPSHLCGFLTWQYEVVMSCWRETSGILCSTRPGILCTLPTCVTYGAGWGRLCLITWSDLLLSPPVILSVDATRSHDEWTHWTNTRPEEQRCPFVTYLSDLLMEMYFFRMNIVT